VESFGVLLVYERGLLGGRVEGTWTPLRIEVWYLCDGEGLLCHRVGCVADEVSPIGERDVASVALLCVAPSILWLLRLVYSVTLI
jgi:hypothetical protein